MPPLVTCPACGFVCKIAEGDCAQCGVRLRASDGMIPLTAAAAILGLSMAACGPKEPTVAPAYGVVEEPNPTSTTPEPEPVPDPVPSAMPSAEASAPVEPPAAPAYGVAMPPPEKPE